MTSGVKQALPQVLMPKTGGEGKVARNPKVERDFGEALGMGKFAKQLKAEQAKVDGQGVDVPTSWPRMAAKLDTAIDRAQGIGSKLAVPLPEPDKEPVEEQSAEDVVDVDTVAKDPPDVSAIRPAPETAQTFTPYPQTTAVPVGSVDAKIPDGRTAVYGKPEAVAAKDLPADDRPAPRSPLVESIVLRDPDQSPSPSLPIAKSESAASAVTEPEAKPLFTASATEPTVAADAETKKDATQETVSDAAKPAPRVTILSQQNIPAPMPSTAIVLVESIAASDLLEPARTVLAPDAIHASAAPASAQSLKIQLHPAELGMVTATLRFAGEQLSIELQVENHEAYRRLTSDSDTIVSSLRDLGCDIDRVTVLQPSLASPPSGRSDAGATMPSPQGRAPEQFGSGAASGGSGGSGGRQSGEGGNAGQGGQQNPAAGRDPQGNGLYI